MALCPCGLMKPYLECCAPFIEGKAIAETPEALMRSRYTAYTKANIDYIKQTMRGAALEDFDEDEAREWATTVSWLGLHVLHSKTHKERGSVEFIATIVIKAKKRAFMKSVNLNGKKVAGITLL